MNGVKCRYRTHLDGSRIWTLSDNTGRFFNISAEEDFLIGKIKAICEVNGVDIPAF